MRQNTDRTPWASHSLSQRILMSIYDWFALGLHCRFIWRCRADRIVEFYNQHISSNHLDIGVGTGFFLDKCRFPSEQPRLVLMDINSDCLAIAQKRLKRYQPEVYQQDILAPVNHFTQGFDSIALSHLLHCLPGTMEAKEAVFSNILPLLNPGGIVFGTTFLNKGIKRNLLAGGLLWWANREGFMCNSQDSLEGLDLILDRVFREHHIELCECEALFWGRR